MFSCACYASGSFQIFHDECPAGEEILHLNLHGPYAVKLHKKTEDHQVLFKLI